MKKAWINWSSGKDSALALYYTLQEKEYKVERLFTTLGDNAERVSMHEVSRKLLLAQARNLGLDINLCEIPTNLSADDYNLKMQDEILNLKKEGLGYSIFGDIFLEDLKKFREQQLEAMDIKAVFPLWKHNTRALMQDFLDLGFKAIVVCVNTKVLDKSFCGRLLDQQFLFDLPEHIDPCGENGEFHTFVFDGPIFHSPINFEIGEKVKKSYKSTPNGDDSSLEDAKSWDSEFIYCDLKPK
ncbi:diphthine--ammonia ligase [Christiangramia salexigens]|uniref:ATP-binding protein n=1 Tax=Christiangramia salexigens TaxID=1913577 RepID=A0A1L3J2M8_9FLAO|nr:diphthine--ammonia ligase [Christiangramia salexigens]APG59384.1 ATP-binding protein [Christiangramia salexigens]